MFDPSVLHSAVGIDLWRSVFAWQANRSAPRRTPGPARAASHVRLPAGWNPAHLDERELVLGSAS